MKTLLKFIPIIALAMGVQAQTITPNTTLCAAVTSTATSVCLQSTTNIANQTGLYIGAEMMTVVLTASQTLPAGPTYVPVARGNRSGVGAQAAHNNGDLAWEALNPSVTVVPGENGFSYSTQFGDVGPCTRSTIAYLPHIWPDRNVLRDCAGGTSSTGVGVWVDYAPGQTANRSQEPFQTVASGTALSVSSGNYVITDSSAIGLTLAAPTATVQDYMIIQITSSTAHAHTLTATGLLSTGTASVNEATFAAHPGAGLTLMSYQGTWIVLYSAGITFS